MQLNMKTKILSYSGEPIPSGPQYPDPENPDVMIKPKDLTLGDMCIAAFNNQYEGSEKLDAMKKVHRGIVSQEIYNALKDDASGMVDMLQEDIVDVKELMNRFYTPMALMKAFELLDPKPASADKKAS